MIPNLYNLFELFESYINCFIFFITFRWRTQPKSNRILITKLDHIGDFILFSSSLKEYRKLFPTANITLLVQECTYNIAELCPYVDEIWKINQRDFRRNLLSRIKWGFKMRNGKFDIVVNAVYSTSVFFLDCLVGFTHAKRRIGFACGGKNLRRRGKLYYTELVPETQHILFEIDRNFRLLSYLGYNGKTNRSPEVWVSSKDLEYAQNLRLAVGGAVYGILFPGSRQSVKIWPLENYCCVLSQFSESMSIHWIVCGSSAEVDACDFVVSQLKKNGISSSNLAGKTSLRELAAVIKGASVYLGNDTMAVHLAAAFDVPSVCVLGGGHYGRFYPYPDNNYTKAVSNQLDCYNCEWECKYEDPKCIISVTIQQVVNSLFDAFEMKKSNGLVNG